MHRVETNRSLSTVKQLEEIKSKSRALKRMKRKQRRMLSKVRDTMDLERKVQG